MEPSAVVYVAVLFLLLNAEYCAPRLLRNRHNRPPKCYNSLYVECNLGSEKPVWAKANNLNKQECIPFLNRCFFNTANCFFFRNDLPLLQEISREECEKLCTYECPVPESSNEVCAYRGGYHRKFGSLCELQMYSCQTAEVWTEHGDKCDDTSISNSKGDDVLVV